MALTGRFSFNRTFTGKIVLQVEEEVKTLWPFSRTKPFRRRWRNAKLMDLAAPELRMLMDLRYKPMFMAQYQHLGPEASPQPQPQPQPQPVPGAFDGIPVPAGQLLSGAAARRETAHDVSVEVQALRSGISGHA